MRIGWNGGGHHSSLDAIREQAKRAVEDGFASFWLSQITGSDACVTDLRVNTLCPTPDEAERTRTFLRAVCREKNRT